MVEHSTVNRQVVGSNPTWGVFSFFVLLCDSCETGGVSLTEQPSIPLPNNKQDWIELLYQPRAVATFNELRRSQGFESLDLSDSSFRGLNLSGINFSNCILHHCDFEETLLHDAVLVLADLGESECFGTQFFHADLTEADFSHCMMAQCVLEGVNAQEANFSHADLNQSSFLEADLSDALFEGATLNDTNFTGATLNGANFTDALMEFAILENTLHDEATTWSVYMPETVHLESDV